MAKRKRTKNGTRVVTSQTFTPGPNRGKYVAVVDGRAHFFAKAADRDDFARSEKVRLGLLPAKRKNPAKRKKPCGCVKRKANGRRTIHRGAPSTLAPRVQSFIAKHPRAVEFEMLPMRGGGSTVTLFDARGNKIATMSTAKNPAKKKPARKVAKKKARKVAKKKTARRSTAKRKRNGSEVEAAAKMFRKFHGQAPKGVKTVTQLRKTPDVLADCGRLVELVVDTGRGGRKLAFRNGSGVRVATTADGGQLYFVGGDQAVNLADFPGISLPKDQVELGELATIVYHTSKDFHDFEPSEYEHHFGETGKARPVLCYDVHSARLYLVGGGYQTKRPGIMH